MKKFTFKELISLVESGVKPVIIVTKKFADGTDLIYSEGMKTRVVAATNDYDGCIALTFDCTEFDEFNRTVAKKEWYDVNTKKHTATYFEYYERKPGSTVPMVESWYFAVSDIDSGASEEEFGHFEVEEGLNNSVFFLYRKDVELGCKMTYVQWLEDKVMATLL